MECDCKGCEAEEHFTSEQLEGRTLGQVKYASGWRWLNYHDVCPQCEEKRNEEIRAREA